MQTCLAQPPAAHCIEIVQHVLDAGRKLAFFNMALRQKLADQGEKRGGAEGLRVQKLRPDITKKGVAQASLSL
jgi:hypothetical protein